MYVCLCKALTEADVALAARECINRGTQDLEDLIEVLGLRCEEACGYCVDHPEIIEAIASDELESQSYGESARHEAPSP